MTELRGNDLGKQGRQAMSGVVPHLSTSSHLSPRDFTEPVRVGVVAFEGNCMAGKSTLVKTFSELLQQKGGRAIVIPEYVEYLSASNALFERPFKSDAEMEAEGTFYLDIEKIRQQEIEAALSRPERRSGDVIILDRTFFTCLAYAELSDNPVSRQMFAEYLASEQFIHPDLIIFLEVDPESAEYQRRKEQRREGSPNCLGLNWKIQEYGYIYKAEEYNAFFRVRVSRMFPNIEFVEAEKVTAEQCLKIMIEKKILPSGKDYGRQPRVQ